MIEVLKQALEALEINLIFLRNVKPFNGQEDLASDCVAMTEETITSLRQAIAEAEKQEPVAVKRMMEWVEGLKRQSDYGQHMKILSGLSAGTCWELANELEQFINTTSPQRTEQEPVGKLKVTLEDRPIDIELAQYKRMFEAACSALGEVSEALGCDPNDGGSEPLIEAIERLKSSSQEPIAWMVYTLDGKSVCVTDNPTDFTDQHHALPLYTNLPQRTWQGLTDEEREKHRDDWHSNIHDKEFKAIEAKLKEKNNG
jgi:hypothetical protein